MVSKERQRREQNRIRQRERAAEKTVAEPSDVTVSKDRRRREAERIRVQENRDRKTVAEQSDELQKHRDKCQQLTPKSKERVVSIKRKDVDKRLAGESTPERNRRIQFANAAVVWRIQNQRSSERRRRLSEQKRRNKEKRKKQSSVSAHKRAASHRERMDTAREQETPGTRKRRLDTQKESDSARRSLNLSSPSSANRSRALDALRKRIVRVGGSIDLSNTVGVEDVSTTMEAFSKTLNGLEWKECKSCNERSPFIRINKKKNVCVRCDGKGNKHIKFSHGNNMDPGEQPECLKVLTVAEQMAIALHQPMLSVYRLPGGQLGYRGHVINFEVELEAFAKELPRLPKDFNIIVVRKSGENCFHKDFLMRRDKVEAALKWLQANNKWYSKELVTINDNLLSQLPESDTLDFGSFKGFEAEDVELCAQMLAAYGNDSVDDVSSSFVPMAAPLRREQDKVDEVADQVENEVEEETNPPVVPFPRIRPDRPINEYETPGYIARCFPTLFPRGSADLRDDRRIKVDPSDYFKHLMLYKDGRLARHPTFAYFAWNSMMRWEALQTGKVFVRQRPEDALLTVDDLRNMTPQKLDETLRTMMHVGSRLKGTRAYWHSKKGELMTMIDTKGMPHIFFTLSAADMQWPELHNLFKDEKGQDLYPNKAEAVFHNPLIADWFFYFRVQEYLKTVLRVDLDFADYWLRFEYQHRGSPHIHGVAWLRKGVDVQGLRREGRDEELAEFIDSVMCTMHPDKENDGSGPETNAPSVHPSTKLLKDILAIDRSKGDTVETVKKRLKDDLRDCLNSFQQHTKCRENYCLTKKGPDGQKRCRFNYPRPISEETEINRVLDDDGEVIKYEYVTKRNHDRLNPYHPKIVLTHRANSDIQVLIDRNRLINYVVKYASKEEPRSQAFKDLYQSLLSKQPADASLKSVAQSVLLKIVGERDISAQEVMHNILGLPLISCSRTFQHLNTSGYREISRFRKPGDDIFVSNAIDRYMKRPAEMEKHSLFEVTQDFDLKMKDGVAQPNPRGSPVIVVVHPYLNPDPSGANYEEFCKQALLLHKPFREVTELKGSHQSFAIAWENCEQRQTAVDHNGFRTLIGNRKPADPDHRDSDDDDEDSVDEDEPVLDDWMHICRLLMPEMDLGVDFGYDVDPNYNWNMSAVNFDLDRAKGFLQQVKPGFQDPRLQQAIAAADPSRLNGGQKRAYDEVVSSVSSGQVKMIVYGMAGTGKTYLIHCLKQHFGDRARLLAPTGKAANNIGGQTLHSAFTIHCNKGERLSELFGDDLAKLQNEHKGVAVYLIDEISMVGRSLFGKLDARLRQVNPERCNEVFGGKSIVVFGDFGQLQPVMDKPLYSSEPGTAMSDAGRAAYLTIDRVFILDKIERQGDDNRLRDMLIRLRNADLTDEDYAVWQTRFRPNLSEMERDKLSDAQLIFPTREKVREENRSKLVEAIRPKKTPVAFIEQKFVGPKKASTCDVDTGGGLSRSVIIAVGCKVMLTKNIWTDAGLANGSFGTVHSIIYQNGKPPSLPDCVVIAFEGYSGPPFLPHVPGSFPIFPVKATFTYDHGGSTKFCTRENLPLQLAYSVTVHKIQGTTLRAVHAGLGDREFSAGLSYVALSRSKKLDDLMLEPFLLGRFRAIGPSESMKARMREDLRLYRIDGKAAIPSKLLELEADTSAPPPAKVRKVADRRRQVPTRQSDGDRNRPKPSTRKRRARDPGTVGSVPVPGNDIEIHPVDSEWMRSVCEDLALPLPRENRGPFDCRTILSNQPPLRNGPNYVQVRGDGNCFYRAISHAVTGSEDGHKFFRDRAADFVDLDQQSFLDLTSGNETVHLTSMRQDGEWSTDLDIFAAAASLGTKILVYDDTQRLWQLFDPSNAIAGRNVPLRSNKAIIIDRVNNDHFNLILNP